MMESKDIPFRLMQGFFQFCRHKFKFRPEQGLNPGEIRVLRNIAVLDTGQGVMVSLLSTKMKVSPSFITQMTNGLVDAGLADRSPDPDDRRAVRIRVTPRGDEVMAKASQEFIARFERLADYLGPEQSEELCRLMAMAYQYFDSSEGKDDD
jgi:DNA-binding MarR family transcriptional regulator